MLYVVYTLLAVAFIVGCGLMFWLANRIEPHWSTADGRRFLCMAEFMDDHGVALTGARETRVIVLPNGLLQVDQKRSFRRRTWMMRIEARSPSPPKGRVVYLLRGRDDSDATFLVALRLPQRSRAIPVLDGLLSVVHPTAGDVTS